MYYVYIDPFWSLYYKEKKRKETEAEMGNSR